MEKIKRNKSYHSHWLMGYRENTGATSRKVSLDFAMDKTINQDWERCGN